MLLGRFPQQLDVYKRQGYNYNGKLRCKEVLWREAGGFELIRRAETPRDYFATLDVDPAWETLEARWLK